jgi:diacylglycerol kinase
MQRRSLSLTFRDAFRGIGYVLLTQRNAKIQATIGLLAVLLAGVLQLPPRDWAVLTLMIAVVLAAETANTVVETIVDVISPATSEPARIAKDASAGAVLLLAIGSVVVGLFLLGPPLWKLIEQTLTAAGSV